MSDDKETVATQRGYTPMNTERKALRMGWEEYILYALEVEREQVNQEALTELAEGIDRA